MSIARMCTKLREFGASLPSFRRSQDSQKVFARVTGVRAGQPALDKRDDGSVNHLEVAIGSVIGEPVVAAFLNPIQTKNHLRSDSEVVDPVDEEVLHVRHGNVTLRVWRWNQNRLTAKRLERECRSVNTDHQQPTGWREASTPPERSRPDCIRRDSRTSASSCDPLPWSQPR